MSSDGSCRAADAGQPATDAMWDLRGRRILSWRNWDLFGAGVYDRGEGEGTWRSTQHRLVFSLTPLPPIVLQIDGGPARDVHAVPEAVTFYPAGPTIRTVGSNSRYAQVCWSPELYQTIAPGLPGLPGLPDLQPDVAFTDPLIGPLVRALVHEVRQGPVDRLMAESLMSTIAMRVAHRAVSAPPPIPPPGLPRPWLRRVVDYIEARLAHDLTLAELAGVACLSPCHFSRSFKQAMGVGPQRYTVQRRVERAKELLRRTDGSLAGIAVATGFADQSHFTAAFRRETGLTPGRFRAASG